MLTNHAKRIIIIEMERSAKQVEHCVEDMILRCREAGMNVTPQRIAVYRALLESEEHPSPEMLYNVVRQNMPSLSLATIYKTLETLQALGLVHEVSVISDTRRYDANMDHHHHLVCTICGGVSDYYSPELDALLLPKNVKGFTPRSMNVSINGICADCNRGH